MSPTGWSSAQRRVGSSGRAAATCLPPADHPLSARGGCLATAVALAAEGGRASLAKAGLDPRDIGLLALATPTPDQSVPATSAAVAAELGLTCGTMDLNAACAGWV